MSPDFVLGFLCAMLADVVWCFCNFLLQAAFKYRAVRKQINQNEKR